MNSFSGRITLVKTQGHLSLVTVGLGEEMAWTAVVIDTPHTAQYLVEGHPIKIVFKETEVVIGTIDTTQISMENRIPGTIRSVERGDLLSRLVVETPIGKMVAIIGTESLLRMGLEEDGAVLAWVKMNQIILVP